MLVHCHGCIGGYLLSYMQFFVNSRDEEFWQGPILNPDTILYASDWQSHGSLFGRDAQWLVTTACWLLGDSVSTTYPSPWPDPCNPDTPCDPWMFWQAMVNNTPLESFGGWRHLHHSYNRALFPGCPYEDSDEIFWERFSEMMNDNYQGEDDRWDNNHPADDLSVRCHGANPYQHARWNGAFSGALTI